MAESKLKLTKKVISNKYANKIYSKSFEDLTRSSNPINEEKITDIYNSLFYTINKKGKSSHESIIIESRDYLYPKINKKLDSKIDDLIEEIERLNAELLKIKTASPSNPEYPNGSFITAGNSQGQFQGMPTVWVMQDGMKRALKSEGFYKIARQALKVPGELYSELFMLSVGELNQIPDGLTISKQKHFSLTEFAADYDDVYYRFSFDQITLKCEGREAKDSYDLVAGDFWLDDDPDDACTVTYVKNEYKGDTDPYSIETITIPVGAQVTIEAAKDKYGEVGIPQEVKDSYDDYYNYDVDIQSTGTRLWGKDAKYKGILFAEGRIMLEPGNKFFNTKTNESIITDMTFDEMFGNKRKIYSHGCKNFYGEYEECFGNLNQTNISLKRLFDDPSFNYYQTSVRFQGEDVNDSIGNAEIKSFKWNYQGSFNNWERSKPVAINHRTELAWQNFPVYGQPILRISGKYAIYLKSIITIHEKGEFSYHYFYNLEEEEKNKSIFKVRDDKIGETLMDVNHPRYKINKELVGKRSKENSILKFKYTYNSSEYSDIMSHVNSFGMLGKGNSKRFFWEAVDISKIRYIGLSHHERYENTPNQLTGWAPNKGNYFNPFEDGSNFEVTAEAQEILNQEFPTKAEIRAANALICPYKKSQLVQYLMLGGPGNLPQGCTMQNCLNC